MGESSAESGAPVGASDADKKVEIAAVRLLARREHGTRELKRKLTAKGHEDAVVERIVEKLGAKRLVSDERFVSSFILHHSRRGQGPVKIKAELRQRGMLDPEIDDGFRAAAIDWLPLAIAVRRRKFAGQSPRSASERAKQARFLQYRGFTADQIRAALADQGADEAADPDLDPSWSD